jgi:general secretion pathway protein J
MVKPIALPMPEQCTSLPCAIPQCARPTGKARGFTLIELLIAITILAIVTVLGWRGLETILRARTTITGDVAQLRSMQLAFAQIQSDCDQTVPLAQFATRPTMDTQPDKLTLIRRVQLEDQPPRYQVVAYRIVNGTLVRRVSEPTRDLQVLDTAWNAVLADQDKFAPVTLHSGVASMALQVWFNDGAGWRASAQDKRKPAPGAPPAAINGLEVKLQLAGQGISAGSQIIKTLLLGVA